MRFVFKWIGYLLDVLGITWCLKFLTIVVTLGIFTIYLLNTYTQSQIAMGVFLMLVTSAIIIGVLGTHGSKGDMQDVGYKFEMGQSRAKHNFGKQQETLKRGFI